MIKVARIDPHLAERIPHHLARKYCILPVLDAQNSIVVITPDGKDDAEWLSEISTRLDCGITPYKLGRYSREEVSKAIEEFYSGKRMRLGELLLINGAVTEEQLEEALRRQELNPDLKIGDILRDLFDTGDAELQEGYAAQIGYRFLSVNPSVYMDLSLVSRMPKEMIQQHNILPSPKGDIRDEAYLLTAEKLAPEVLEEVRSVLGLKSIEPVMTTEQELKAAIDDSLRRLGEQQAHDMRLGDLLLERKLLTESQLQTAIKEHKRRGVKLGEVLVEHGLVSEKAILEIVSQKLGVDYMITLPSLIPPEFKDMLTEKFATFNRLMPIGYEDEKLVVAMANPQDEHLISMLSTAMKRIIKPVLASVREINKAITRLYSDSSGTVSERLDLKKSIDLQKEGTWDGQFNTQRIVNLVNNILVDGVRQEASDIHLSPREEGVDLFLRLDGSLVKVDELPIKDRDNVTARIKIMSEMRIDARHIPQSGRIVARIGDRHIDFRVSTLPTQFGENVVLRILDSTKLLESDLSKLGVPPEISSPLLEQCERSQGIILVTGPTGSGKTTTLYHVLNWLHVNFPYKSISTIESPIEYVLEGIVQSEVNDARGLTSAAILKEKLRQDPDVIMVGEIRNLEEGSLAFTAALTGHTVFSTLHTNDGATTVRRLVDMGLEPYNVSTAINCILSQRLAKRNCQRCVADYKPTDREVELVRRSIPDFDPKKVKFKKGLGCEACNGGYKGRVGIYEMLVVDSEVKQLISQNATDSQIRDAAVRGGMKTLRRAGLEIASEGITSLEEVFRVTDIIA